MSHFVRRNISNSYMCCIGTIPHHMDQGFFIAWTPVKIDNDYYAPPMASMIGQLYKYQ